LDDHIGIVLVWRKDKRLKTDTIVMFATDNGAEVYFWSDCGTTPFAGAKGHLLHRSRP
jgi:arylsulfatase A-like enzyme